jgi:predicted ribosomally synthesized peptide with nif11-like leader
MSKDAARKFYEHVKTNQQLAGKIENHGPGITNEDFAKFAAAAGFDCTVEELDEVGMQMSRELSDDQLQAVTGGSGTVDPYVSGSTAYKVEATKPGTEAIKVKPGIAASGLIPCTVVVKASKL